MRGFKTVLGFASRALSRSYCSGGVRAQAQSNYPNRPIRIIVPPPPPSSPPAASSTSSRAPSPSRSAATGSKWSSSRHGRAATATSAPPAVARSEPDGYTWLVTGPAALVNPTLYKDAGWDAMKDFRCVGLAVWAQSVRTGSPIDAGQDRRASSWRSRAKSPARLNFGNPGTGSSIDLSAQKLFQAAGIKLTNVGYKGQPQALIDLMTNLMHFEIVSPELALPHIKAGGA